MSQPDETEGGHDHVGAKTGGALTNAQRQAAFRARQKELGVDKATMSNLRLANQRLYAEIESLKRRLADVLAVLQLPNNRVHLDDYPNIRLLFLSAPGLRDVDRATLYSVLDNGWKWVDWQSLLPAEQTLIDQLAIERGDGWIGGRYVLA
jgi:hypothetical protein